MIPTCHSVLVIAGEFICACLRRVTTKRILNLNPVSDVTYLSVGPCEIFSTLSSLVCQRIVIMGDSGLSCCVPLCTCDVNEALLPPSVDS